MSLDSNIPNSIYPLGTDSEEKPVPVEYVINRDGAYVNTGIEIKNGLELKKILLINENII